MCVCVCVDRWVGGFVGEGESDEEENACEVFV
jgi:hypothetical protein